jgi:serine protease Do
MKKNILLLFMFLFVSVYNCLAQDLSELYEKVSPAIVVIYTSEKNLAPAKNNTTQMVTQEGLGSGFMISDRLIVTAAHVVTVPEKINVLFPDGDVIRGSVVSIYKSADIALIKLFRPRFNPVTVSFGNSDDLKIGERIFVVGAPFGLNASLSSGYVSNFRKNNQDKNPFTSTEFIQTDAAINTGNSGGPMFNLRGEVVGIVSHILTQSGGFEGIGYASSSNLAARLLLNNNNNMPWLGADMHSLSENEAKLLNVPQKHGLLVQRVVSESIFGNMGIRGGTTETTLGANKLILGGDIILAFNAIKFSLDDLTLSQLAEFANSISTNPKFKLSVLRDGKIIELNHN